MPIATKTLQAINTALIADQGAKYRGLLRKAMPLAEDAYSEEESEFRAHLGASLIGRECSRELWYSFRWATRKQFDGRILRLFNRGHLEEPRFVALLQMLGCKVHQYTPEGKQFRITGHKGHYGGSLDSVIEGCPDMPGEPVLGEFKTHNDKSFQKLKSDGVMAAKWEHFVQMQQYMGHYKLNWALYLAANKNDDEIHGELIAFDAKQHQKYLDRSVMVIESKIPPPKINESASWFKCRFCDHSQVCHGQALPVRTCRSCVNGVPIADGKWHCSLELVTLTEAMQLKVCPAYMMIPEIKGASK
jgi:ribosomal protein S27E